MKVNITIPEIPEEEITQTIRELLNIISQFIELNKQLSDENRHLKDEIAKLKGVNPKPKIKPSSMDEELRERKGQNSRNNSFDKRDDNKKSDSLHKEERYKNSQDS